jgi:hypothetical protein
MAKRYFEIDDFTLGMADFQDQEDVPENTAVYAYGIDPIAPSGILRGQPDNAVATYQRNVWKSGWLRFSTQHDLVYIPYGGGNAHVVDDYYGTPSVVNSGLTGYTCIEVNKQAARLGRGVSNDPQFAGYITGLSGPQFADAKIISSGVSLNVSSAESNAIALNDISSERNKIFLAYSLVFDGGQEGTLVTLGSQDMVTDVTVTRDSATPGPASTDPESVKVNVDSAGQFTVHFYQNEGATKDMPGIYRDYNCVVTKASIPSRATHINLYLAWSADRNATVPDTYYYLINTWDDTTDGTASFNFTWKTQLLESYQASSGRPQTLTEQDVQYELSTQLDGYHWVGAVNVSTLSGGTNYLLRSELFDFDSFYWSQNYVELPTRPTALAAFNGRIYAFDEHRTYRVNPQTMEIEDTFEGAGATNSTSVFVSEYGMFHCDRNNVYHNTGSGPRAIAWPIMESVSNEFTGWREIAWGSVTRGPYMTWDKRSDSLIVVVEVSTTNYTWLYNLPKRAWYQVNADGQSSFNGAYHEQNGELCFSFGGGNSSYKWFSDEALTTRQSFIWTSRYITLGEPHTDKKFYQVFVEGDFDNFTGTTTLYYRTHPTTTYTSVSMTEDVAGKRYHGDIGTAGTLGTPWSKLRGIQFKIICLNTVNEQTDIYSLGFTYRMLNPVKQ